MGTVFLGVIDNPQIHSKLGIRNTEVKSKL
jgi:hypothetical protein